MFEYYILLFTMFALIMAHLFLHKNNFSIINPFTLNSVLFTFYFLLYPLLISYSSFDYDYDYDYGAVSIFALLAFVSYFIGYHTNNILLLRYTESDKQYLSNTNIINIPVLILLMILYCSFALFYKLLFLLPIYILGSLIIVSRNYKFFFKIVFLFLFFLLFLYAFLYIAHERRYLAVIFISFILVYHVYISKIKIIHSFLIIPLFIFICMAGSIIRGGDDITEVFQLIESAHKNESTMTYSLRQIDIGVIYPDVDLLLKTVPDNNDYLYGSTLIKPFLWIIPRELWPEKPETVARKFIKNNYPELYDKGGSRPVLLPGELYYNFGFFGVIVGMLLYGKFTRYIYAKFYKKHNFYYMGIYIIFLAHSVALFRGGLAQNIHTILFFILIPYISLFILSNNIPKKVLLKK